MVLVGTIILIAWSMMSLLTFVQYSHCFDGLDFWKSLAGYLIFIIGGPFFCIVSILNGILDWILPEGWDEDDNGLGV